jgi:hypothetical protein
MRNLTQLVTRAITRSQPSPGPITVVSGLPRSGTSLMMKMLDAGGIPILMDNLREADVDNPKGYYELERVKQLDKEDGAWLEEAQGKAVKVISALLKHLPLSYTYQVIFMHRNLDEVLASQKKMLKHRGEGTEQVSDAELCILFLRHKESIREWLLQQQNISLLDLDYNVMLTDPHPQLRKIAMFLHQPVDIPAMLPVIEPGLYRNRAIPQAQ